LEFFSFLILNAVKLLKKLSFQAGMLSLFAGNEFTRKGKKEELKEEAFIGRFTPKSIQLKNGGSKNRFGVFTHLEGSVTRRLCSVITQSSPSTYNK
jgi:hypothetical protein